MRARSVLFIALLACCNSASPAAAAEPALHEHIDRLIAAKAPGPVAARSSDAEFLRRVCLDLTGAIPTSQAARAFLNDNSPNKRALLIDRLLASPEYARRMGQALTVMLLERRSGQTITDRAWNAYAQAAFAANKPWNAFVQELISADGNAEDTRPAIRFFVDGGRNEPHQMTQDVARIFLGMDLACARCHDHPHVDDFKQAHYYGLYAYLNQSKLHPNPKQKKPLLIETAAQDKVEFQSVFAPDSKQAIGPRLPGRTEVEVVKFEKGAEFERPPQDGLPGVPKFRPRQLLSADLTAADNHRFVKNSVNRFWFLMLGRGLVHPLDMLHSGNPPSHPELLELLAREFAAQGFDVKRLLREIALSEVYQRSSLLPAGLEAKDAKPESYRVARPRPLSAEQMAVSVLQATGNLRRVSEAQIPEKSPFTYKDYINGRIPPPDNLPDVLTLFAATFGNPPGEAETDFRPSVKQSLFLLNERLILQWLAPARGISRTVWRNFPTRKPSPTNSISAS